MLGDEHLDVALTRENMAIIYKNQGQYEKALEIYKSVLETKIRVCGHEHRDVANSKYNMALLHKRRGEMETARQLFLECETIYAKVYGPDHSKTLGAARQASLCV